MEEKKSVVAFGFGGKLPSQPYIWNHAFMTAREAVIRLNQQGMGGVSFWAERLEAPLYLDSDARYNVFRQQIETVLEKRRPHAVVLVGLFHGSATIRLETTGRNVYYPETYPEDTRLIVGGEEFYQTSFPLASWCKTLENEGFPVSLSHDAGQMGCNAAFYWALHTLSKQGMEGRAMFVHLPYTRAQARQRFEQTGEQMSSVDANDQLIVVTRILELAARS